MVIDIGYLLASIVMVYTIYRLWKIGRENKEG
jgi:hypothetical protein